MRNSISFCLLIALFCIGVAPAEAQKLLLRSDTLVWQVDRLKDVPHDTIMEYHCQFLTYGDGQVSWIQQGGNYINNFRITRSTSDWNDASSNGSAQFKIKGDFTGTASFSKVDGTIEITLDLQKGGRSLTPYVFIVSSIRKNKL